MRTVIFACVHNAGRSQMAAAFFNALAVPDRARAESAGTEPASRVHPEVIFVMSELGIDVSKAQPRKLTDDLVIGAHLFVSMGCGDCPPVPGLRCEEWDLEDPKGKPIARVREIRDEILRRVERLVAEHGWR
jgi:arsenate reductase